MLGTVSLTRKQPGKAIELCKRAVALSPNHAVIVAYAAMAMILGGEPQSGLPFIKRAMRLSPIYPPWYYMMVGVVHHASGDHERAIEVFRACLAMEPQSSLHRVWLTSAKMAVGQENEAKQIAQEVLEIDPGFSAESWVNGCIADPRLSGLMTTNLVNAGLPR